MAEPEVVVPVPVVPVVEVPKTNVKEHQFEVINAKGEKQVIGESVLIERYKKSEGLEAKVHEASKLKQAFENFVSQSQDPQQLLSILQKDLKYDESKQEMLVQSMLNSKNPRIIQAVKKWIYDNEVEPATLSKEEREMRELRSWKEQQELKIKAADEAETKRKLEEDTQRYWAEFKAKVGSELTAQGMPMKEAIVSRVARYALLYRRAGKEIDFKDCVGRVRNDLVAEYQEIHKDAADDKILDFLPEGMAEKINKALLNKLKAKEKEKLSVEKSKEPRKSKEEDSLEKREATRKWMRNIERGIPN